MRHIGFIVIFRNFLQLVQLELLVYINVKKTRAVLLFQGYFRACSDRLFEPDICKFYDFTIVGE